ncbi:MAG: hypothetical protein ACFB15_02980 [Cyclobacteriaceae bacterium]
MKQLAVVLSLLFFQSAAFSQPDQQALLKQAGTFLDSATAEVLLLGVFHFNYPGLDGHKTSDENRVDILVMG